MRIFSGVRPTGDIHIGNYFGAIAQWVSLQKENECFFSIVDYHAITTPFEPREMEKRIFETLIVYLAAGIDPERSTIFVQSQVKEHTELAWIFGTITPVGELKRMTQFKEKARQHPEYVNAGLLNYPLLMAADILLYQAEGVPVGKDQVQHLELAREIAKRFNKRFGETFKIPQVLLSEGEKIMSLENPRKKMSKTDGGGGVISLFDSPEEIREKIMKAVTDSGREIRYDPKRKPGISNLLKIYSLFAQEKVKTVEKRFRNFTYHEFKKELIKMVTERLEVFRKKKRELENRKIFLREMLQKGRERAQLIASETMNVVKGKLGLFT